MQWVRRAGPSRICVSFSPCPSPSSTASGRYHEPLERELAVPAMFFRPHDRNAPDDAPARLVAVEEEGRQAVARIVRRPRDQDEVLGFLRPGDEPFVPCTT